MSSENKQAFINLDFVITTILKGKEISKICQFTPAKRILIRYAKRHNKILTMK